MAERLNYQCKFEKYKEELIRLRRHFHRHPELGLQEFETSAFIQEYLGKLGYRFRIVEPTGIIAEHPCQDEAAFAGKKKGCASRRDGCTSYTGTNRTVLRIGKCRSHACLWS